MEAQILMEKEALKRVLGTWISGRELDRLPQSILLKGELQGRPY